MAISTSGIADESAKEKEMLTSGDMLLGVIPGPWRRLCGYLPERRRENGCRSLLVASCCPFCCPRSPPGLHLAGISPCLLLKEERGQRLSTQSKHSSHHALPLFSLSALLPLPPPPPGQFSHQFRLKPGQKFLLHRAAWIYNEGLERDEGSISTEPLGPLCRPRAAQRSEN